MKNTLHKYCEKKAVQKIRTVTKSSSVHPISICIPVNNEYPSFFSTLRSLHLSALTYLSRHLVDVVPVSIVCCVNARTSDSELVKENNAKLIYELVRLSASEYKEHPLLNLIVLDYTSDGYVFDTKQGVGLARKIAMDYAVINGSKVLACLDADTLVSASYIFCLELFYKNNCKESTSANPADTVASWALTGFSHQKADDSKQEKAIRIYEKYLLEHSSLLLSCGTPYYPVALGPTIICTSSAYTACGGMNTRCAGEDFYFLQSLLKLHVQKDQTYMPSLACRVFPSSRISNRVLFGTGKKIQDILNGTECSVFKTSSYDVLKQFITLFQKTKKENPMNYFFHEVYTSLQCIVPFLEHDNFFSDWVKIYTIHNKNLIHLENAFHDRFDGLKIIRLFHYLENIMQ